MNIYYEEQHSMDVFHNNVNVQELVDICLKYYNTFVFDDIIGSITVKTKKSAKKFLDEAEIKYVSPDYVKLFLKFKQCILNLFDNPQIKNLKGAFLEVLSFRIFNKLFKPHIVAKDCRVWVDNIPSDLTVDIAMEYVDSALICECKVPSTKYNWNIFKNLLDIKSRSLDYYNAYTITLDSQERMNSKKSRIKQNVEEAVNIGDVKCIHRETIGDMNSFLIS